MRSFEFRAGCLCLDLVDTLSARGAENIELLISPEHLIRWASANEVMSYVVGVTPDQNDLRKVRHLREAAFRAASASIDGGHPATEDIAILNEAASAKGPRVMLASDGIKAIADQPMQAMMAEIAIDAIQLLGTDRRLRVRRCPGCNMLFYDGSPPGKRKWCSSASGCGNRSKIKKHRQRKATDPKGKVKNDATSRGFRFRDRL